MTWDKHAYLNALKESKLPPVPRTIARLLADEYANKNGKCWPSYQTMAAATGYSRRSAIRAIDTLSTTGWLRIDPQPKANKDWDSNHYYLLPQSDLVTEVHQTSDSVAPNPPTEPPTKNQDRMSVEPEDRMSVGADAPTAKEQADLLWGFRDEQMPAVRCAVRQAAYRHLAVICRRQEENYLIRTLTRSGRRRIRHDLEAYAAAAFKADPEKWRALLVAAGDNDGHVPDSGDELPELLLSSMRDDYGYETGWDMSVGLIDFRDYDLEEAA